jgi:hypothetical protein
MCYTKKDRELEKEARRITESRLMEEEALPSSKSVCSILPIARHLRAGEVFSVLTPARGSLLKPAAGQ